MANRFDWAAAFLARRQARRGGATAARVERQARLRLAQPSRHPDVVPGEDVPPAFSPKDMQGPSPVLQTASGWSEWTNCPSTGGRSGRRMADQARFNSQSRVVQIQFASGGPGGVPNTYEFPNVSEIEWINFLSGRLGGGQTYPVVAGQDRFRWSGYKVG